jgi:hypothetical protein
MGDDTPAHDVVNSFFRRIMWIFGLAGKGSRLTLFAEVVTATTVGWPLPVLTEFEEGRVA